MQLCTDIGDGRRPLSYKYIVNNTRMLYASIYTSDHRQLQVLFLISSTSSIHELSDELILLLKEKII
jgi:hypothetical protein